MPVVANALRTRSASCPMMAKMLCGGTTRLAAATRCASSGWPAISCSTLGRCDLRRVPLPAARMAMANCCCLLFAALAEVDFGLGMSISDLRELRLRAEHADLQLSQ